MNKGAERLRDVVRCYEMLWALGSLRRKMTLRRWDIETSPRAGSLPPSPPQPKTESKGTARNIDPGQVDTLWAKDRFPNMKRNKIYTHIIYDTHIITNRTKKSCIYQMVVDIMHMHQNIYIKVYYKLIDWRYIGIFDNLQIKRINAHFHFKPLNSVLAMDI